MAKYTSDANLIRGAATAYKNYDNAPGMYAGLDKAIKAGTDTMNTAVENYEAEQEKKNKEAAAEKQKKKDQDNLWYKTAGEAYENAGSFMKDIELKDTIADLDKLQVEWVEAMENGSAAEKSAVQTRYNNIKTRIDDHKAFREQVTDPKYGISDAMKNSGAKGGNDGRKLDFLTGLTGEKYEVSTNDKGEKIYSVTGNGSGSFSRRESTDGKQVSGGFGGRKQSYNMKEIQDLVIMKDMVPYNKFDEFLTTYAIAGVKKSARPSVERRIGKSIPTDFKELHAFMSDKGFESEQSNMADLLRKDEENIRKEIDSTIFDTDTTPGISDDEFEAFVQATVDPHHALWQKDGKNDEEAWSKNARRISIERLANAVENEHALTNPEDPTWKKEGYANKGAYLKAVKAAQGDFTPDADTSEASSADTGVGDDDRTKLLNLEPIIVDGVEYKFSETNKGYIDSEGNVISTEDLAEKGNLIPNGQAPVSYELGNIQSGMGKEKYNTPSIEGGATLAMINKDGSFGSTDDNAVDNLNAHFDSSMQEKYTFEEYGGVMDKKAVFGGAFTNNIKLVDKKGLTVKDPSTGEDMVFATGPAANSEENAEKFLSINKLLKKYIKKQSSGAFDNLGETN